MNDMGNSRILKKCALTELQLQQTNTKYGIGGQIGIYLVTKMPNSQKGPKKNSFQWHRNMFKSILAFHIHDKQGNT